MSHIYASVPSSGPMRPASATTGLAPPTVQSATLPRPQRGTRLRAGAAPRERGGKTRIAFGASRNPQPGRPQSGSSSSGAGSAPFLPFLQTLPSFAQILNLLGETGFGDGRADGPRSPLGSFYRWLLRLGSKVAQPRGAASSSGSDLELAALSAQQRERIADLCAVLACSQGAALRLAAKHPQALDLPSADIVARVLGLKRLLPGCDIVFLISNQPALYFQVRHDPVARASCLAFALHWLGTLAALQAWIQAWY